MSLKLFLLRRSQEHSELLDTALPCCAQILPWQSHCTMVTLYSASDSARGGSAVGNGNIWEPGDRKFHLLSRIWGSCSILKCTLKVFCSFRSLPIWTFSKEIICFWCMERAIKASLVNLLMLLQSCSAGMIACTGEECSERRKMRSTFRLIRGWREAHIRNIKHVLGPLIHHKYLI